MLLVPATAPRTSDLLRRIEWRQRTRTSNLKQDNRAGLIAWFVAGAVLGGVVALLTAPQSGKRTRRALEKTAEKGRKSFLESSQEIVERGRELFERGREIAQEAAEALEKTRKIAEKTIEERF